VPKYKVLDPAKFKYADKLRQRQRTKSGCSAIILVDSKTNLSLIPVDVELTTPMKPRVNFWEIHLKNNGKYGGYGEEQVKKLAKRLDAVAYMC
jgi:hypothetical protein